MHFISTFIAFLTLSTLDIDQNQIPITEAQWLLGTWEMKTSRGSVYESWKKTNSGGFSGMSYMINETDTTVFERVRLVVEGNVAYYMPTVANQNDGKEIRFKGTTVTDSKMVFENRKHDFPQKIEYTLIKSDSLVAEICGEVNGEMKKQVFPMKKL